MPCATKPSCAPFSGEMSGRTAVIIPIPKNETDATIRITSAAGKFASSNWRPKNSETTTNSRIARTSP